MLLGCHRADTSVLLGSERAAPSDSAGREFSAGLGDDTIQWFFLTVSGMSPAAAGPTPCATHGGQKLASAWAKDRRSSRSFFPQKDPVLINA